MSGGVKESQEPKCKPTASEIESVGKYNMPVYVCVRFSYENFNQQENCKWPLSPSIKGSLCTST